MAIADPGADVAAREYVASGGAAGPLTLKDLAAKHNTSVDSIYRRVRKLRTGTVPPAPVIAAPVAGVAQGTAPPAPHAPAGPAPATNPAAAAAKAAATMGLPAAGPAPGAPPPPPVLSQSEKAEFCLQRIGFVKASSAWLMAKRYGIDTERTPLPRSCVELSEPLTNEIKLNADFLYPYLSAVSGPWALAAAAVFEVVGMIGALKETAKKSGAKPPEKKPDAPKPAPRTDQAGGGWAPAGAPAPEAVMPG